MTELGSIIAAGQSRLTQDSMRLSHRKRTEQHNTIQKNFTDRIRRQQELTIDARLAERRIQDRRDLVVFEQMRQIYARDRQANRDKINNDESFVLRREELENSLSRVHIRRDINELTLIQEIAEDRSSHAKLHKIEQRNHDAQAHLIDRNTRLGEREDKERTDAIRQERQLRRSIERINSGNNNFDVGPEALRGGIVDVSG